MIMGIYEYRSQKVAGDVFEFRLYASVTGGLAGKIPSITTVMPSGYIGACFPESPGRTLVVDGNKNLYYATEPSENGGLFTLIKSSNGGSTWTIPDVANSPTKTDLESVDATYDSTNKCIHIAHKGSGTSDVVYHRFRTSDHATNPDTWQIVDEVVTASVAQSDQAVAVQHRSDTTVVCLYRKTNGAAENMFYKIRSSGGSWGSEQTLDAEASIVFGRVGCVVGASDKIHIFYNDWTNGILYHRSLSSADSLSGRETVATGIGTGSSSEKDVTYPVYWDSSGNEKIMVAYRNDTTGRLMSAVVTNVHVLQVLRLAGIPLRARDRGPHDPLVILGGAAMFLNPEPLAPFADLAAVGEGEPMVPRMMEALLGAPDPRRGLESLRERDGFYVPSRYEVRYRDDGTGAAYDGPGFRVAFNSSYVIDVLRAVDDGDILVSLSDPLSPCLLRSSSDPRSLWVVMPMRID